MESLKKEVRNPSNKTKQNILRKMLFAFLGIFLGIFFIVVILYVLSYLKVINLPLFLETAQQESKTNFKIKSLHLTKAKAEKAGYSIVSEFILPNEISKDASGRRILASKERVVDGWVDEFGWQKNLSSGDILKLTGIFIGWEEIKNSNDRYLLIQESMESFQGIKIRIIYNNLNNYEQIKNKTLLEVDNLDYGPLNNSIEPIEVYDYFDQIKNTNLDKMIKEGDVISVFVSVVKNTNSSKLIRDEYGNAIAEKIQIRRFGGLKIINDELL